MNGADLVGADFTGARLDFADLSAANLSHATLEATHLTSTRLRDAILVGAQLVMAKLDDAELTGADLRNAIFYRTMLGACADLHCALGLDAVTHQGRSALDTATLRATIARLPDPFLLGVGLTSTEVGALRELYQ
jgi:uncharacterized protein YjbI with pentapeptide repeats